MNVNGGHPVVPMLGGDGERALIRLLHHCMPAIHLQTMPPHTFTINLRKQENVSAALDLSDCMVLTELASRTLSPRGDHSIQQ